MIGIKYFEYIGILTLLFLSIEFTRKTTTVTKDINEIMIEIKNNYSSYNISGEDATINNNTIVPGKCYKKVNINKSYIEMKKIGFYNPDKYVYKIKKPSIGLYNNLDKYVISGNKSISNIYIFINLNNFNKKYIDMYKFNNYNFIVNYDFYINNEKIINKLIKNNNSILINESNKKQLKKVSNDYYLNTNKRVYCYNSNKDDIFLKLCTKSKSNSISNIEIYKSNYLYNIKNNLSNGIFLNLDLNNELINEIGSINSYIESKGYNIRNIDNNLTEC